MEGMIGFVIAFIVVAVMLSISMAILGSANNGFDCTTLTGYTPVDLGSDGKVGMTQGSSTSGDTPAKFEGWALECKTAKDRSMQAFGLLGAIVVVIGAAAVLAVVRRMT